MVEDALEQNVAIILIPCIYPIDGVRKIVALAKTEEKKPAKKTAEQIKAEEEKKKKELEKKRVEWIERTIKYGTHDERKDAVNKIKLIKDETKKRAVAEATALGILN